MSIIIDQKQRDMTCLVGFLFFLSLKSGPNENETEGGFFVSFLFFPLFLCVEGNHETRKQQMNETGKERKRKRNKE